MKHAPATSDGWAAWGAASACLRGGLSGVELDTAAALALAIAQGVPAAVAAELITAFAAGMHAGLAARRAADKEGQDPAP